MKLVPRIVWEVDASPAEELDRRLVPLLQAISATGSLKAAVASCAVSYRAAWGVLRESQRVLGCELVALERGRGACLTEAGTRLVEAADGVLHGPLQRELESHRIDLRSVAAPQATPSLVVAASHDLALSSLRDALNESGKLAMDVDFVGSLTALRSYAEGRVAAAGFHLPLGDPALVSTGPFMQCLRRGRDRLLHIVDREQGFIVAAGSRSRVTGFTDIVRRRLRFVNRQRGSGTRAIIDALLAAEGVSAPDLAGSVREEFTHAAVAATIASGGADVGFGLRAAAAEYRLHFVPRVRERYFMVVGAADSGSPAVTALRNGVASTSFRRLVRAMPGYQPASGSALVSIEVLRGL